MKLARAYARAKHGEGKKTRFLALENSFHGRTFGAVSLTWPEKYRKPFEPLVPGVEFVRFNDVADLESKFADSVCAIFVEPMQGEGGIFPVSEDILAPRERTYFAARSRAVADEIQCGLGARDVFRFPKISSPPDIVMVAKPLAGGITPRRDDGKEEFASAFTPGMHGSTFGGGPLSARSLSNF